MSERAEPGADRAAPSRPVADRAITGSARNTLSRYRVVKRLSATFDVTLGPLALVAVCLLIVELLLQLESPWDRVVFWAQIGIWAVFILAFVLEISLAPKKLMYLRRNWLLVISLALPALRVLRAARALRFLRTARVVRSASVARGFTSLRRAVIATQDFLGFSQLAYLAALTVMVWLAASGLVYFLEANQDSEIDSVGEAMWWCASVLTTVGISAEPESLEGRIVAIALRVFGVAIIGYFTARLAAFFFGQRGKAPEGTENDQAVKALREEMAGLREELRAFREDRDK